MSKKKTKKDISHDLLKEIREFTYLIKNDLRYFGDPTWIQQPQRYKFAQQMFQRILELEATVKQLCQHILIYYDFGKGRNDQTDQLKQGTEFWGTRTIDLDAFVRYFPTDNPNDIELKKELLRSPTKDETKFQSEKTLETVEKILALLQDKS
jgi:hypothetical protein